MSVKVTDNTPKIKLDTQRRTRLFLRFLLDDVDRYAFYITPKKEGELRKDILKVVTGVTAMRGTIEWRREYAAAQEVGTTRGFTISNYTTPGTGKGYALRGAQKAVMNAESTMRKARLII